MNKPARTGRVSSLRLAAATLLWALLLLGPTLTFALVVLVRRPYPEAMAAEIQRAVTAQMIWPLIALGLFYVNAFWRLRQSVKTRRDA